MREFLKGLFDDDAELIDTIMAEHGKIVSRDKEELQTLKSQVKELEENSKDAEDIRSKYEELVNANNIREAKEKAKAEDDALDKNINALFEGKKFTSEYARNGLVNDIKESLNNPENEGKELNDIYNELTKDKTDIFTNPNQITDMTSMEDSEQTNTTKEIPLIW